MIQLLYNEQVISPLKELFLQDEFSSIPDVVLKPNSDLSLISSNATALGLTKENVEVPEIFDDLGMYFDDNQNLARLQSLDHTAKAFASTIENSYVFLNNVINPTVDFLRNSIEERFAVLMTRERAENLLPEENRVSPSENDYSFIDWDRLNNAGFRNEVSEVARTNANINSDSLSNLSYVVKKMNFSSEIEDIDLPAEMRISIIDKLKTVFSNDGQLGGDEVAYIWDIFTNRLAYVNFCNITQAKLENPKILGQTCIEMLKLTKDILLMGNCKNIIGDELNPVTLEQLAKNIDAVNKTAYAIMYWLISIKEIKLKDKLVVDQTIINRPVYEDFVRDGRSIVDVHNYLKVFYTDMSLPVGGVSIQTIQNANTNERLDKTNAKLKANERFIKTKCLIGAYDQAIRDFVNCEEFRERFPQLNDPNFANNFATVAKSKASIFGGDISKVDDVLYDLIINTFFNRTLVATMYKYLGKGFENLATEGEGVITDDAITEAQCDAISEMLIDYLFDTVVE